MNNEIITDVLSLWKKIEEAAHFTDNEYDTELLNSICKKLMLSPNRNISTQLTRHNITCEELLIALCSAIEPFSAMLSDLLEMFERAGAQQSDKNIKINMTFSDENILNFDLKSFMQTVKQTKIIHKIAQTKIIDDPWKAIELFDTESFKVEVPLTPDIQNWLVQYSNEDVWPDMIPYQPMTGYDKLDALIGFFWRFLEDSIDKYKQYYDSNIGKRKSISVQCSKTNDRFWWNETDYWVGSLIKNIALTVEKIKNCKDISVANELENKIELFVKSLPNTNFEMEITIEEIIKILNLPFWSKRYELYSAWISTQIIKSLEETDIIFNVVDNTLSFSFKGAHIATCSQLVPTVEIWAELKTKYTSPIGKSRKRHIQPDYTLAVHPVSEPSSSIAVIECKQYKKNNTKNFSDAVIDYANGRPEANVFLTNYGPISKNVLSKLNTGIKSRSHLLEYVRPNSPSCMQFHEVLRETVLAKCSLNKNIYVGNTVCLPLQINLQWEAMPKDLDLWLCITDRYKNRHYVYHSKHGSIDQFPFAKLDKDDMCGYGNETIEISKWNGISYDIFVCNYSGEPYTSDFAKVSLSQNQQIVEEQILPNFNVNKYLHIFHIDSLGIKNINAFVSDIELV